MEPGWACTSVLAFTQHCVYEIDPFCCMYLRFVLFHCCLVSHCVTRPGQTRLSCNHSTLTFVSSFWLLQMKPLCTFFIMSFAGQKHSLLPGIDQGAELLGDTLGSVPLQQMLPNGFPRWLYHFSSPSATHGGPTDHISPTLVCISLFNFNHSGEQVVVTCAFHLHYPDV